MVSSGEQKDRSQRGSNQAIFAIGSGSVDPVQAPVPFFLYELKVEETLIRRPGRTTDGSIQMALSVSNSFLAFDTLTALFKKCTY
jgi:hypothetical protein